MKIAIIGAGAAGLAALRHSLEAGHECVVFEQTDKIGGTWNYTDDTYKDENGLPVHSSMYQGLKTNLPKELMEYEDFPYEEKGESYIDQQEVIEYISKYASHFNLYPHIKFLSHIIAVTPISSKTWKIKGKNLKTNAIIEQVFASVIICVGNYSVPKLPNIPGSESLEEMAIHSHHFRKPDQYKGKKVLIVGAGPSGVDIARLVGKVAEKVSLSYGSTLFVKTEDHVVHKPLVKSFEKNKAKFTDGSEQEFDNVIYCTGYRYSYPFLTPECMIKVENNWIKYLYKNIVNVEHPTMGFIGVTFRACPFPMFDIQVRFFLQLLKGPTKITKEEMMSDIFIDVARKKELGFPPHHVHRIGNELQKTYFDDLADTVHIKKSKPVLHELYNHVTNNRNTRKRYKILSDEEFIILDS